MTPIILLGAQGRMGQAIIACAADNHGVIVAGVVSHIPAHQQQDFPLYTDLAQALKQHGQHKPVIVDFSKAELSKQHIDAALEYTCPLLIGTTGHHEAQEAMFHQASAHIPVLIAPNTSLMVVVMKHVVERAARALPKVDTGILEIHHKHKKDAPSGTARDLAKVMPPPVAIESLRMGEVIGEHTVYFTSDYERLEITHRASDRRVFAQGALYAAQFLFQRHPGLYDMNDVLNLN